VTKSPGFGVGSRPSPYSHAKLALLIPATTKSGQFGLHLCRIAGGSDDIIIVIQFGETAKRLPENIRVADLRHVRQTP
jgi:hypothetical protein